MTNYKIQQEPKSIFTFCETSGAHYRRYRIKNTKSNKYWSKTFYSRHEAFQYLKKIKKE